MRYVVIIEAGETSYGAYVPDLPGCVAVGDTVEEVRDLIGEAVQFHLEGLREDGIPIPQPRSTLEYVEAWWKNLPSADRSCNIAKPYRSTSGKPRVSIGSAL